MFIEIDIKTVVLAQNIETYSNIILVLLPGKFHGWRSLVGCGPWGCYESGRTEQLFTFHFSAMEKEMAIHSSTLAWKIPWREEPGRLQPMGLRRIGHD